MLIKLHRVSKNCALLFLSELRQISINFNKCWYVYGKVAEIVCYIDISHLTWPTSLHYLVKHGCSKFLPDTGFISYQIAQIWCHSEEGILSQRLSCLEATVRHAQVVAERFFCVSTERHSSASRTQHCCFPGARETREMRRRLSTCVRVRGTHFKHEF